MAYLNGNKILFGTPMTVNSGDGGGYDEGYKDGQIALLKDSKYMNADVSGNVVVINDISPIVKDLSVKVVPISAENLLTTPYEVSNAPVGVTVLNDTTTIRLEGTWTDSLGGLEVLQFREDLASTLTHGVNYYSGIHYVGSESQEHYKSKYPINLFFMCSGSNGSFYNVDSITWDNTFTSCFLVVFGQAGVNYTNCEFIPILSTEPIGSGDIDLTTISVSRYGKNLVPYPYSDTTKTINGITFTDNGDGTITVNGTATSLVDFVLCDNFLVKKGMHISGFPEIVDSNSTTGEVQVYLSSQYYLTTSKNYTKTIAVEDFPSAAAIKLRIRSGYTADNLTIKPQIEFGTIATEYEPYVEPQIVKANADGTVTGLTSIHPNMTLISDTKNVNIECNYYKDIDTYIDNLMTDIAMTGGV